MGSVTGRDPAPVGDDVAGEDEEDAPHAWKEGGRDEGEEDPPVPWSERAEAVEYGVIVLERHDCSEALD